MINGSVDLLKTGWQGRRLPWECGKWGTLSASFTRWRRAGVGARVREALRQRERQRVGRQPAPAAGRGASQRRKTAPPGPEGGCDGGQKSQGRNRPRGVAPLGRRRAVVVTAAEQEERLGVGALLPPYFAAGVPRVRQLWVDGG